MIVIIMLAIDSQTALPNGVNFFEETLEYPGGNIG